MQVIVKMMQSLFVFQIVVLLIMLPILSCGVVEERTDMITEPYNYPIEPGTDAWKDAGKHDDRVQACQIPEDILKKMTTGALLETVLNYPHFGDMWAYDSLQYGFERVAAEFNGLQELLNRKDTGIVILSKYRTMDPGAIDESWTSSEKGGYVMSFTYPEILLAQDSVLANMTESELEELLAVVLEKVVAKGSSLWGGPPEQLTSRLAGKLAQAITGKR